MREAFNFICQNNVITYKLKFVLCEFHVLPKTGLVGGTCYDQWIFKHYFTNCSSVNGVYTWRLKMCPHSEKNAVFKRKTCLMSESMHNIILTECFILVRSAMFGSTFNLVSRVGVGLP